ncbi:MAG: zf-HC2 domain-containing protein [Steroidobacteraceae bacterium]
MNFGRSTEDMRQHTEVAALLPWYVNGTLGERDRQRVDSHLRTCASCRDELLHERRVYQSMAAETGIEYMPAASLKRLQARLDSLEAKAAPSGVPVVEQSVRRTTSWQRSVAASVAVMAVALSLIAADRWMHWRARVSSPDYHTVTTSEPRSPDEVIRAVFSPTITLVELQSILDEAQLRIISGPTEAGVYSLAANSRRPVSSSLALLRRHAAVRFAEATQPNVNSGNSTGSVDSP